MTSAPSKPGPWRRLPLLPGDDRRRTDPLRRVPLLFFQAEKHDDGLRFRVSDLVHVWTAAKTSRAELTAEAVRTGCSIDPGEDGEQYEVLVGKLEEAVAGRGGAKVWLTGDDVDQRTSSSPLALLGLDLELDLGLATSIPLPDPLGLLEWEFRMVRDDSAVLTREVIMPALRTIDAGRERQELLRRRIKEKDHVIGKLMDKIESSGIDLGMMFPGFAGPRTGFDAGWAAKVVPGVEPFRDDEWVGGKVQNGGDDRDGGLGEVLNALRDPQTGHLVFEPHQLGSDGGQPPDLKDITTTTTTPATSAESRREKKVPRSIAFITSKKSFRYADSSKVS